MQGFGNSVEDDCRALLGVFIEVGESLKGQEVPDQRYLDSEPLVGKIVCHAFSALYLSRGTRLDDVPPSRVDFVDYASVQVITRALLESVWAFHHVFVEPDTEDEFTFRHSSWMIVGLVQRQKYPALTPSARRQLADDRQVIDSHRQTLQRTKAFAQLSARQKERALNGQLWRPPSLRATATAFLGNRFGATVYSWLSSYQHGDALSAIQIREARSREDRRQMADTLLFLVAVSISQMIKAYVRLWPQVEAVTNRYPNMERLVEAYVRFPHTEPDIE